MFRAVLIILLFGALQGAEQNDTDTKESLEKMKSDIEALSYLIASSLKGSHYKLPIENNAVCSWKKVNDSVEANGFLIPGAKTIEACQDACERTKDCLYCDWIPCQQLCYLPIRPTAQRYQLTCPGLTGAKPPPPPVNISRQSTAHTPPLNISRQSTAHTSTSSSTVNQTQRRTTNPMQPTTPLETVKLSTAKTTTPLPLTTPFETTKVTKPSTPATTTSQIPSSPSTKADKPTTPETTTQPSSPTPLETDEPTTPKPTTLLQSSTFSETESPTTPEKTSPLTSATPSETTYNPTTPETTTQLPSESTIPTQWPATSETDSRSTPDTTTTQLPSPTPFKTDRPTTTETTALPTTTSTVSPTRPTVPVCKRRLDLVFVVDGSGSICNVVSRRNYNASCANWDFNLRFINMMIERLVIGPDDTNVALVMFSTLVRVEWTLNKYKDMTSLQSAVEKLSYPTGMTNTADALQTLVTKVFTRAAGDRPYVPNRAILITDGEPNTETVPLVSAIRAVHHSGIKVFVVGVTKFVNEKILRDISSPPQKINETYFLAEDYSSIDLVGEELLKETCIR